MSGTFAVFDVETPNASNSRMSAIGLTVVEDGRIVDELFTLVNPETYFHPFNVALTGITPEMAERAPTFDQLWETIGPMMSSGLLVAQMPASMEAVEAQTGEDLPRDLECYVDADGNVYDFAYGLNWSGKIDDQRVKTYSAAPLTECQTIDFKYANQ